MYMHRTGMAPEPKTGGFYMRMGETEDRMLEELSERIGLSRADVIRQLIRREHTQVFGDKPRAKPKPKRK
jgi:hypothetical protein